LKYSAKEVAEAMASEGLEPALIKRVLINLGFSNDEAVRAVARACIIMGRKIEQDRSQDFPQLAELVKKYDTTLSSLTRDVEEIKASLTLPTVKDVETIERRVSVLESKVNALIDLLSDYAPMIIEKVRARGQYDT